MRVRAAGGGILLIAIAGLAGCGAPLLESQYVEMADGTRLAVDVWLPRNRPVEGVPTILRLGRYWRDYELPNGFPAIVGRYPGEAAWLNDAGYAVALVDVRGTGASYGVSTAPFSPQETGDFPRLADWVIAQPWSNGLVGGMGVSYEGVTADWLAAFNHPAVKAVLPTYAYTDVFLDVSHPGGILNARFLRNWGEVTARMDRNDTSFIAVVAAANPRSLLSAWADVASALLLGVRPITGAGDALLDVLADHARNPHVFEAARRIEFRDDLFSGVGVDDISPLLGPESHVRSAAIRRIVGWQDAGTARGALRSFNTLAAPDHVVILAPQTHTGNFAADPYHFGEPEPILKLALTMEIWAARSFFDAFIKTDTVAQPAAPLEGRAARPGWLAHLWPVASREVIYWTFVENAYKSTPVWPPEGFEQQRWYLAPEAALSLTAPDAKSGGGVDVYTVDFEATTGLENRWFSGMSGVPIRYLDRAEQDTRLLVYETPPFVEAVELTGHPLLSLHVASTHEDGAFYAYLEDVALDGTVVYLTEGQLRAIHRKVSEPPAAGSGWGAQPPAALFGPYHSFRRDDAWPLVPGEVAEITFDLHPISTLIVAGHRLRLALGGHDADTFIQYPAEGTPVWTVYRTP
ncbi:MAG: CocE/NonD family hydrolase, partial [Planctomycetota bacterium]